MPFILPYLSEGKGIINGGLLGKFLLSFHAICPKRIVLQGIRLFQFINALCLDHSIFFYTSQDMILTRELNVKIAKTVARIPGNLLAGL